MTPSQEVEHVLKNHPNGYCAAKVARLFGKSPWLVDEVAKAAVVEESWDLPKLQGLLHVEQETPTPPNSRDGAIIVLRWNGRDYLIDGRRRINQWVREKTSGPFRVLVIQA